MGRAGRWKGGVSSRRKAGGGGGRGREEGAGLCAALQKNARRPPSSDALASSGALPCRVAHTSFTIFAWPFSVRTSAPASESHTAAVPSADAVASWPPPASHATRSTAPLWPRREHACAQLAPMLHSATLRSREEEASKRPAGEKAHESTSPACAPSRRSVGHSRKEAAAAAGAVGSTINCASRCARLEGGASIFGGPLLHRSPRQPARRRV